MRRMRLAAVATICLLATLLVLAATHVDQAQTAPPDAEPRHTLQLLSPGPTSIATHNQAVTRRAFTAALPDEALRVAAGPLTFSGVARNMRSVAIVVSGRWHITVPDAAGSFRHEVDLSGMQTGPITVDVYAWDTSPDQHQFTVALNLRVHLFVEGGVRPPAAASRGPRDPTTGRRLVWSEEFDALSPAVWHAGPKPDGQEYGAALLAPFANPAHDPYTVVDGFLRIRARHVPGFADPKNWRREWITGHLSTGFPDGSATATFRTGYMEARMLMPAGAGTWSSFWLLDQRGIRTSAEEGAVEIDVVEAYGHDVRAFVASQHDWPPPARGTTGYRKAQRRVTGLEDYSLRFHDFGVEITGTEVIFYLDREEKFRTPLFRAQTVSPFFIMLTLAISHDWPIEVPPSGYYDLWIDHVRVYQ